MIATTNSVPCGVPSLRQSAQRSPSSLPATSTRSLATAATVPQTCGGTGKGTVPSSVPSVTQRRRIQPGAVALKRTPSAEGANDAGAEPSGPGPHFHRTIAESFYVLVGTVRIFDGAEWRDCTPGDFVHVPPGGIHGFRNESGEPASMLLHFAPGASREGYFEGLARFATEGRPGKEELDRFYAEHDNFWV